MLRIAQFVVFILIALALPAAAGIPRGLTLSADEQVADEMTGWVIARGNAEIAVGDQSIFGRADIIELRPESNEVLLKGRAVLTVGRRRYESNTVACSLDFVRCTAATADQVGPLPAGSAATSP